LFWTDNVWDCRLSSATICYICRAYPLDSYGLCGRSMNTECLCTVLYCPVLSCVCVCSSSTSSTSSKV
jgi:hypothetical protein